LYTLKPNPNWPLHVVINLAKLADINAVEPLKECCEYLLIHQISDKDDETNACTMAELAYQFHMDLLFKGCSSCIQLRQLHFLESKQFGQMRNEEVIRKIFGPEGITVWKIRQR
jgi:hypothetical protein